jgi:PhoPQ-activated pathogenicity-related protein
MAKAAFQSMRAIEEYTKGADLGVDIEGWVVSGASKRGWTTWMVGAATCTSPGCPNIIGIAPLVPIVPDLHQIIHRQYQSLGGFTFAFVDYKEAGILQIVDEPSFRSIEEITDPGNAVYADRLARLPKYVVVSSDDEFMQLDWTPLWYDSMASKGETHLLIIPNTEHSLSTGIPELLTALPSVYVSMSLQQPREERPYFSYSIDNTTGELSVTVPAKFVPSKVVLHHGQTTGKRRRDFRWIRIGGTNETEPCSFPNIPSNKSASGVPPGAMCLQPIVWGETKLAPDGSTSGVVTYKASPPKPRAGHWVSQCDESDSVMSLTVCGGSASVMSLLCC